MSVVSPLATALMNLQVALQKTQPEIGWLYSNTTSIQGYDNNPKATAEVTERLGHLSAGLLCVYVFAVLEEYIDPRSSMWTDFLTLLPPRDLEKLKAFKHVRNTMAHGFEGARAVRNAADFDSVMGRPAVPDRIQSVESFDADKIKLGHHAGWECYQFIKETVAAALVAELN